MSTLMDDVEELAHRTQRDVYVLGSCNVGKSTYVIFSFTSLVFNISLDLLIVYFVEMRLRELEEDCEK
jgi:hypothetical protein